MEPQPELFSHTALFAMLSGIALIGAGWLGWLTRTTVNFREMNEMRGALMRLDTHTKAWHDELEAKLNDFQEYYRAEHRVLQEHAQSLFEHLAAQHRDDVNKIFDRLSTNGERTSRLEESAKVVLDSTKILQSSIDRLRNGVAKVS